MGGDASHRRRLFLYYALLHAWGAGHPTILSGRVFSMLCALPTLPIVNLIGTRLFDRRIGWTASLLCALNVQFLTEAREVRMYGLLATLDTASWLALLLAIERPAIRVRFAIYGLLVALSLWTHPLAAFNAAAQLVAVVVRVRDRGTALSVIAALAGAAFLTLPLVASAQQAGIHQLAWLAKPHIRDVWEHIKGASGGKAPALVGTCLLAAGAGLALRRYSDALNVVIVWFVVPPVLALVVSYVIQPVFLPRYLIEIVPAAALLIAWLLHVGARTFRYAIVAILLASTVISLTTFYTTPVMDWQTIGIALRRGATSGDAIWVPKVVMSAYRLELGAHLASVPPLTVVSPAANTRTWDLSGAQNRKIDPRFEQLWVLASPVAKGKGPFLDRYRLVATTNANLLELRRYLRR